MIESDWTWLIYQDELHTAHQHDAPVRMDSAGHGEDGPRFYQSYLEMSDPDPFLIISDAVYGNSFFLDCSLPIVPSFTQHFHTARIILRQDSLL